MCLYLQQNLYHFQKGTRKNNLLFFLENDKVFVESRVTGPMGNYVIYVKQSKLFVQTILKNIQ